MSSYDVVRLTRSVKEVIEMYTMIRTSPYQQLLRNHLPMVAASLVIAEVFYKFGSFTLETVAFLGTWFVLDAVVSTVTGLIKGVRQIKGVRRH